VFPGATVAAPAIAPDHRMSWLFAIAPYMEGKSPFGKMPRDLPWDAEENRYLALWRIKSLQCPAFPPRPPSGTLAPTHYVGIAGVGMNAAALPLESPGAGVFGFDRPVRLEDVKDGLAYTMFVAETLQIEGAWTAGGRPTVRGLDPGGAPYLGRHGQFGSGHFSSVTHVGMADGSARALSKAMNPRYFEALATIAGGDDIGPFPK
jgi:hypothetical protein